MMTNVPPEVLRMFARQDSHAPSKPTTEELVSENLARFLESEITPGASPTGIETRFADTQLPDPPWPEQQYLRYLFDEVVPHSVKTHSPRFIGHMTSSLPSFVDSLGRIMTTLNQNVVKLETSNAFTFYERQALAITHRVVFGCPPEFYATHVQRRESTLGMLVSGGTLANVAALWCARNARLRARASFAGIEAEGLHRALDVYGFRRAVVIGSAMMHYSLEKAADLLGIGRQALLRVPARENGEIDLSLLEQTLRRCRAEGDLVLSLVGIAGTTETGAVDPLPEMADLASAFECHLHVDAAWGGPVLFSRKHRARLKGIERADSVTVDGHKQLYLPMGLGILLLRDPEQARAIETVANYIVRSGSADLGRRTLEGSRPAMAIYLHGALHMIGRQGYEALVDDGIAKTAYLAELLSARPEFELLASPRLNIVVYRCIPPVLRGVTATDGPAYDARDNEAINDLNRRLQEIQRDTGRSFISRTTLINTRYGQGAPIVALRAVLANPLTTREDIAAVLDEQAELCARLCAAEPRS